MKKFLVISAFALSLSVFPSLYALNEGEEALPREQFQQRQAEKRQRQEQAPEQEISSQTILEHLQTLPLFQVVMLYQKLIKMWNNGQLSIEDKQECFKCYISFLRVLFDRKWEYFLQAEFPTILFSAEDRRMICGMEWTPDEAKMWRVSDALFDLFCAPAKHIFLNAANVGLYTEAMDALGQRGGGNVIISFDVTVMEDSFEIRSFLDEFKGNLTRFFMNFPVYGENLTVNHKK